MATARPGTEGDLEIVLLQNDLSVSKYIDYFRYCNIVLQFTQIFIANFVKPTTPLIVLTRRHSRVCNCNENCETSIKRGKSAITQPFFPSSVVRGRYWWESYPSAVSVQGKISMARWESKRQSRNCLLENLSVCRRDSTNNYSDSLEIICFLERFISFANHSRWSLLNYNRHNHK